MSRSAERAMIVGAFAAPLALAMALRLLGGPPGPSSAFAQDEWGDEPAPSAPALFKPNDKELKAAAYAASKRDEPIGPAPLLYPKAAAAERAPAPAAAPADPTPTLTVNSIMAGRGGAMATVNGKLRRVGDEVAPGWKVSAIDPVEGTVTVAHADGREVVGRRAGR